MSGGSAPREPNAAPMTDDMLLVPFGVYRDVSSINKFGLNASIDTGVQEEIWDGSAAYPFPATALMTKLNTTVDQAALRGTGIEIQGLDADWVLTVQTVLLDASNTTTLVDLDTPLIRVFRMKVLADVVATTSVTLVNDADNVLYGNIEPGNNQTEMAIFTVPANHTAFVTTWYGNHLPASGVQPTSLDFKLWAADRAVPSAKRLQHHRGIPQDEHFQHFFRPYLKYTEKTDLFISVKPVGATVAITAGFDLILVNHNG